ncbi:TIR domain-containing protein [Nocardia nepalensis]|uniref:TIR domain-containing protein n=1 Tax=Nocardia nepalensis TaxID=3375448 RepID=UPI003B67DEE9
MNESVSSSIAESAKRQPDRRQVFVIHGRNAPARQAVFTFLRSINLTPIEWSRALDLTGSAAPYIGDVLTAAFTHAQAVVVLQTPDDIAYLDRRLCDDPDDPETRPQSQPRPNVLFEAGMAMGSFPERTVLVEFGRVKVFSDIHGRHSVRLDNSIGKRQMLAQKLQTAGCDVDLTGTDWHTAGDLTPPAPGDGLPAGKTIPPQSGPPEPRLDGRYIDRGGSKFGLIEIVNHGPGDVYDLDVPDLPNSGRGALRGNGTLPIKKLPEGKSVVALNYLSSVALGENAASHLTLTAVGKTDDGRPIEQELFISLGI